MTQAQPSLVSRIGLAMLCLYLVSGYATDLSVRFLGTKPYLSMLSGIGLFVCFLLSGRAAVALQTRIGKLWGFLLVWMVLATLTSRWRGGSVELMTDYVPKQHLVLFYMLAVVVTVHELRTVLRASALGGVILLLTCVFFGYGDEFGRFTIPTNIYLSNPNDLAMQLLICAGFFLFLWKQPGLPGRIIGLLGLCGAAFYVLKTGSRGAMVASGVFCLVWIMMSRNRAFLLAGFAAAGLVLLTVLPGKTIHRLSLILLDPETRTTTTVEETGAVASQVERERLVRRSLGYALSDPLFGVGPGQFSQAIWEDGRKQGQHVASLGTHNTYTQISSESGVPAALVFIAAFVLSMHGCFRVCRSTANDSSQTLLHALAFSCLVVTSAFSVDLIFHHMAYSGNIALLLAWGALVTQVGQRAVQTVPHASKNGPLAPRPAVA